MKGGVPNLNNDVANLALAVLILPFGVTQVCLPSVVEMFARLTSRYELLFCYTILEQNKRLVLSTGISTSESGAGATAVQVANHLDCFFPFDPYTLKR